MVHFKAMILAAGIGSRLQPLTNTKPKALLEFKGKTMLEHVILKLKHSGVTEIVINVHHHAELIEKYLDANHCFGVNIEISDERDLLMDTGGGIIKARKYLENGGPFLVHNIDIFSNIDLQDLYKKHIDSGALATLAVKKRQTSRNLLFNKEMQLCGWRNNKTGEAIFVGEHNVLEAFAFSGIHVIDPLIFNLIEHNEPFSIVKAYLEFATNRVVKAFDHGEDEWIDMAHPTNFSSLKV